jgi:hypothetical protein
MRATTLEPLALIIAHSRQDHLAAHFRTFESVRPLDTQESLETLDRAFQAAAFHSKADLLLPQ